MNTTNAEIRRNNQNGKPPAHEYLPGLDPHDSEADLPDNQMVEPQSGWWVKRSVSQIKNKAGHYVGYRHQLMYFRTVIMTGVGADCARTLQQQAKFYNALDGRSPHLT